MFNDKIKKIIGQELHKYRCDRFLQLKTVAAKTGIPWYVIDNMEIGSVRKWEYYRHLLEFYGKELKIELIERSGRIGNGTVKNGGGNDRRRIAEGEKLPPVLSDGCRRLNCRRVFSRVQRSKAAYKKAPVELRCLLF
mgnify:FL=1